MKTAVLFFWLSLAATFAAGDWKLVWSDEFNTSGPPDSANWDYEHGFVRNKELQWYQPENALCTNGLLIIEARPEHKPNPRFVPGSHDWRTSRPWIDYSSACLITRHRHEFTYGKFEMRARIDTRTGSWPAFWTLGADPVIQWPACGEVDIMEFYKATVLANFCYQRGGKAQWFAVRKPLAELGGPAWSQQFHIWSMEWDRQKIDLSLDGKPMNHLDLTEPDNADGGNPFRKPVYLLLNLAIGSNGGDPGQTKFPIRLEVDWVRVYQRVHKR